MYRQCSRTAQTVDSVSVELIIPALPHDPTGCHRVCSTPFSPVTIHPWHTWSSVSSGSPRKGCMYYNLISKFRTNSIIHIIPSEESLLLYSKRTPPTMNDKLLLGEAQSRGRERVVIENGRALYI